MSLPGDCRIEPITSTEALERLEPEWRTLWAADPRATPFQSPEWLLPWWRTVGQGVLDGAALRDKEGRLVGLLPLYIYTQPESGRRDRLLLGAGTSDYLGGLFGGAASMPAAALARAALVWASEERGQRWDQMILHQMRADSWLLEAADPGRWARTPAESCFLLSTAGDALPAKMRLNLNRYRRRAEGFAELACSVAQTPQEALDALELLIALHTRRWEQRGESGVLESAAVVRHHRMAVPLLQKAGLLRMTTLSLGKEPMAVLYILADRPSPTQERDRRWYGYIIGIDVDRADLSPGTLLVQHVLQNAAAEGVMTFDMLRGGEQYKRFWGARSETTWTLVPAEEGMPST